MIYLITAVILLALLSAIVSNTRVARLKRMAHTLSLRYDKQVDSVLLPDSSDKVLFFKRGFHQFFHVLTFRESTAFVRVCEDRIFSSPIDKKPLHTYTLVTAELIKDTFPSFVLTPHTQNQEPSPNLPPELATRYTLDAPESFTLPPGVIAFLKAHPACYVECTQTALVYCEFGTVPVAQLQPLRLRAMQLLKELIKRAQTAVSTVQAVAPTSQVTDAELQAQILLKLQSNPRGSVQTVEGTGGRYIYGFILLVLLSGMLFVAWYALHHWVVH